MSEKTLAFLDLLGFSNMVTRDRDRARNVLSNFYNICFRAIKDIQLIEGNLISDSLIAYCSDREVLIKCLCKIYRNCLLKNREYDDVSSFFILPRGGLSEGVVHIENRRESPNLPKNFIVSPALVHSAKMESSIKGSRLLIAQSDNDIGSAPILQTIVYEDSPFMLLENHRYVDALWFADLSKSQADRRSEVRELIDVAVKLVKENSASIKVLAQHIGTLRIGLLSYAPYFKTAVAEELLGHLFNEFDDEKFWLVWLSIFEMAMQSPDSWAASSNLQLVNFYRQKSTTKGWEKLLSEINKQRNQYLKDRVTAFITGMNISTV